MTQPQQPTIQRSLHVPSAQENMIDVDLDLACSYCGTGRIVVQGNFDWRRRVAAHCSNPECGDPDDDDKGREHFVRVMRDGTFDRFDGPPPGHPESMPKPQMSQYRQGINRSA